MTQITQTQIDATLAQINTQIDARAAFERAKNASNDSMQDTLKAIRASLSHDSIASVLIASNVNVALINHAERINARMNVYAIEKIANVARFIAKANSLNHYTLAIFKSALALEASERVMTHKDAVCACSASVKHTDSKREHVLKSTRYAKHTSANTASTQASSSINALQAFDVLIESRDDSNAVTYRVNRDSVAAQQIAARLELTI
jgi:hypothetical protein